MGQNKRLLALLVFFFPLKLWAWGAVGHRIVAEFGASLADPADFAHCHLTAAELQEHVNDPDQLWREQRFKHPDEARAHFFHVDKQPQDWRARTEAFDRKQGFLVYRIVRWAKEAREARKNQDWGMLQERLYGLAHYLGDLTQPLHLFHDYDGVESGLPGIHSQFETKMVARYQTEIRAGLRTQLAREGIPVIWKPLDFKDLIFNVATQSSERAPVLLESSRPAFKEQKTRKRAKRDRASMRFMKKILWEKNGELAIEQLTLAARLLAQTLNQVCQ